MSGKVRTSRKVLRTGDTEGEVRASAGCERGSKSPVRGRGELPDGFYIQVSFSLRALAAQSA